MENEKVAGTVLAAGRALPSHISNAMASIGTGSVINLPDRLIIMKLSDYQPSDLEAFEGPARFRVGLGKNFLLISPMYRNVSFDIIWSPLIARMTAEPAMEKPTQGDHMVFNFALVDDDHFIRGLRVSTISYDVVMAIWRAQQTLQEKEITPESLQSEMISLFKQYPMGIPENFFHAACDFGE